ncbi:hypothetical protein BD779DRAFT_1480635 [Infundibulicybe gibba]|nr:hypothetical protein BD779DRAFT_1480635 [Infundibulicybe gibba]
MGAHGPHAKPTACQGGRREERVAGRNGGRQGGTAGGGEEWREARRNGGRRGGAQDTPRPMTGRGGRYYARADAKFRGANQIRNVLQTNGGSTRQQDPVPVIRKIFASMVLLLLEQCLQTPASYSASVFGGSRWSLTQVLLRNKTMGLDNLAATVYWLAPAMGLTLAIVSIVIEGWARISPNRQNHYHPFLPRFPGFGVIMSEYWRDGHVDCWDCQGGIGPFTFHQYRKSIESTVPLNAHGNPIMPGVDDDDHHGYQEPELADETARASPASRASDHFGESSQDELPSSHDSQLVFLAGDGKDFDEPYTARPPVALIV